MDEGCGGFIKDFGRTQPRSDRILPKETLREAPPKVQVL
jgi:hypothetical protein